MSPTNQPRFQSPPGRSRQWTAWTDCLAVLLLSSLLSLPASGAETLFYRTLGVDEGLSQNFVTAIAQDRDGFMWFGTAGGLNRWDGYEFQHYMPVRDDVSSLSDAVVLVLHAARNGNLWVGTRRGLDCYDPAEDSFERFGAHFLRPGTDEPLYVEAVTSDQAGRIWSASFSDSRLLCVDPRTERASARRIGGSSNHWVSALCADHADRLWVALQPRADLPAPVDRAPLMFVFERCSEIGEGPLPTPRVPFTLGPKGGKVAVILEDNAHRLWFGREGGGLLRFDPRTGEVGPVTAGPAQPNALSDCIVRGMGLDPAGKIWVLTRSPGSETTRHPDLLFQVDPEALTAQQVGFKPISPLPGDDARMERLAVDHSGVLWLGSNGGGLRHTDVGAVGFSVFRKTLPGSVGLDSSFVRAICESRDGSLWVGTTLGLNRIDRSKQKAIYSSPSTDGSVPLPHPNVQAICEDREGNLWIGTAGGLTVLDPVSGQVQHYRHEEGQPSSLSDDYILTIHEDPNGRLWMGTLGRGLEEFDRRTHGFRHHPPNPSDPSSLPSGTILALYTDRRHRLWVGTDAGLARLDSPSDRERRFTRITLPSGALSDAGILSICESPEVPDVVWIGTRQDGLCRLDVPAGNGRFYTTQNSDLPNNTLYGLLADHRGRLWISSNRGLACFDPVHDTFRTFHPEDGLQSSEFNGRAYFKSPRGELFFGGVKGLNSFFPDAITDNLTVPRASISEVHAGERSARGPDQAARLIYRRGMHQKNVQVPFPQRDVTFDYVALHYGAPQRNLCQFKLEPYDTDWNGPTPQRQARYTNLDPGRYFFRVKAISSHGIESAEEATFAFEILPPFHATLWFRGFAALGILAALAGGHRWRTHTLRRRQKELESQVSKRTDELRRSLATVQRQAEKLHELDKAKSNFFANISHEFRTPLMLTLTPLRDLRSGMHGLIPEEARAEVEMAIRNAGRLSELVDQLLMLARADAGKLEFQPREIRLDEFLIQTAARHESLAKSRKIGFHREFPDAPVRGTFDPDKLDQVLSNLLGNALKFTPDGGVVTLRLAVAPDGWATLQVEDTGPGIPAPDLPRVFERFYRGEQENGSLPGTGLGLAVAKECVQLHGGEISAENRAKGGARFTVRLPLGPGACPSSPADSCSSGKSTQASPNAAHAKGDSTHVA